MRVAKIVGAVAALALAGCLTPDEAASPSREEREPTLRPAEADAGAPPSQGGADANEAPPQAVLHAFEGTVSGAAPPSPLGPGTVAGLPPALDQAFEVPADAADLGVEIRACGTGDVRIEILDPAGFIVMDTGWFVIAGENEALCPWASIDEGTDFPAASPAGTYRVVYEVAGTVDVRLRVVAEWPG